MVNRESNVFPGILGRVCDRPCEPACRRGRVEEKAVAICRLKRVAADLKRDLADRLPSIPKRSNGKRVACIGAGPASLTVANDLRPLGYEVTIFEALEKAGGLMRSNIPAFRLPAGIIDEEIGVILDMGVDLRLGHRIESMRALLQERWDAVFVGSGAPRGKELKLPGREEGADNIKVGIEWLEAVAFGHVEKVGERVLIIGVGNTAMDCCRTSLRLGATDVKVMARKPRDFFKASEWELEDAEDENVEIVVNHSPKERTTPVPGSSGISGSNSTSGTSRWSTRSPTSPRGRASSLEATRPSAPRTSSGPWSTVTRRRFRSTGTARAGTSPSGFRPP